jgi:hypothetical protein
MGGRVGILHLRYFVRPNGSIPGRGERPRALRRPLIGFPSMTTADLELSVRRQGDGSLVAGLRLRAADSGRDSELAAGVPVGLDPGELLFLALDPDEYGRALTAQLFGDARLREAWITARSFALGAGAALRLRLRVDPGAEELHALRWELLRDPVGGQVLCRSERVLFSRYLDTDDLSRVQQRARPELRVLVAVANPPELQRFGLAPVVAAAEAARVAAAVDTMPVSALGRDVGERPASLNNIVAALREGYGVLYLVGHGVLADGRPFLWLEGEDGRSGRVSGEEFVRRIADLPPGQRPLLVVLASCQSAGAGLERDAMAALGPALARAGVAAVVAMQGNVPVDMVERLMPAFFRALSVDGRIDRALAVARADLADDHPWWMPALFMQVRDGQLWAAPVGRALAAPARARDGLTALAELARDERVRSATVAFTTDFQSACEQIEVLGSYKLLHDLFQQLEDIYTVMHQHARRLPADELAWDDVEEHEPDLQTLLGELLRVAGHSSLASAEGLWMRRLERAAAELTAAVEGRDVATLKRALGRVYEVLGRELSRMNSALVAAARALRLQQLLGALTTIRDQLAVHELDAVARGQFAIFADGVTAMARLNGRLGVLVATHDTFQEVDDELRRVKELLSQDVEELILAWADISALASRLYRLNPDDWSRRLSENGQLLDQAVAANEPAKIRRAFRTFHHQALLGFNKVDQDLLSLCTELQQIGRPTQAVLKMLA